MSLPAVMYPTPQATITVAEGISTDSTSEFWQRISGGRFIVYVGVPYSVGVNIIQSGDPDTAISTRLAAYPKRIAVV